MLSVLPSARVVVTVLMLKLSSSVSRVVLLLPSPGWMVPFTGVPRTTCRVSSLSRVRSPWTLRVMFLLVSLAAKLTVPLGRPLLVPRASWLPTKSAVLRPVAALSDQATLPAPVVSPLRVTVKTTAVVPLAPSAVLAGAART